MKKTCNRCGKPLDIDKRCCPSCSAFNPFYIAGFRVGGPQVEILEKQKFEENQIEKEITEKEKRRQKIKMELEEVEKRRRDRLNEIFFDTPVKSQYESLVNTEDTFQNEVAWENEVAFIPTTIKPKVNLGETLPLIVIDKIKTLKRRAVLTLLVVLLSICGCFTYLYFSKSTGANPGALHAEVAPAANADNVAPGTAMNVPVSIGAKPFPKAKATAVSMTGKKDIKPFAVSRFKHSGEFALTLAKVKNDLVGKRLSGCGITIRKASDIVSLSNLVFIEQLPTGYLKYKVAAKVEPGSGIYNSVAYVYYDTDGGFIKVDGTNCE